MLALDRAHPATCPDIAAVSRNGAHLISGHQKHHPHGLVLCSWAGLLRVLCVVSGAIYLKARAYPVLDREVSARQLWRQIEPLSGKVCEDWANRDFVYGLSFYGGHLIPPCGTTPLPYRLLSHGHGPPTLERTK